MGKQAFGMTGFRRRAAAIARRMTGEHSVPVLEGAASRRHRTTSLLDLRLRAARGRLFPTASFERTQGFLQFAGFPRSGHSLIGSLIDAHPDALVSHELDIMRLVEAGWSRRNILSLIGQESASFMTHGRYWNGFAYVVPNQFNGRAATPTVVGDKKGDWAVRRLAEDPALLTRLHRTMKMPCKWLLVVRNPFDNIATMSLRRGRVYDRLRVECPDAETFRARLAEEKGRTIADSADDEMIADFVDLCRGVRQMQARIAPEDWLPVGYEGFTADPDAGLRRILDFLDLEDRDGFVTDAVSIVREGGNRSRHSIAWSKAQIETVRAAIAEFDFLSFAEPGEPG